MTNNINWISTFTFVGWIILIGVFIVIAYFIIHVLYRNQLISKFKDNESIILSFFITLLFIPIMILVNNVESFKTMIYIAFPFFLLITSILMFYSNIKSGIFPIVLIFIFSLTLSNNKYNIQNIMNILLLSFSVFIFSLFPNKDQKLKIVVPRIFILIGLILFFSIMSFDNDWKVQWSISNLIHASLGVSLALIFLLFVIIFEIFHNYSSSLELVFATNDYGFLKSTIWSKRVIEKISENKIREAKVIYFYSRNIEPNELSTLIRRFFRGNEVQFFMLPGGLFSIFYWGKKPFKEVTQKMIDVAKNEYNGIVTSTFVTYGVSTCDLLEIQSWFQFDSSKKRKFTDLELIENPIKRFDYKDFLNETNQSIIINKIKNKISDLKSVYTTNNIIFNEKTIYKTFSLKKKKFDVLEKKYHNITSSMIARNFLQSTSNEKVVIKIPFSLIDNDFILRLKKWKSTHKEIVISIDNDTLENLNPTLMKNTIEYLNSLKFKLALHNLDLKKESFNNIYIVKPIFVQVKSNLIKKIKNNPDTFVQNMKKINNLIVSQKTSFLCSDINAYELKNLLKNININLFLN